MTVVQVIPKDRRALSMLKLLADMGIISFSSPKPGSLAEVLADVQERSTPAMSLSEIVEVVKVVRAKQRTGARTKARR